MRTIVWSAALLALVSAGPSRGEGSVSWEEAFDASAAPANMHFRGSYGDGKGKEHRFEVWRQKDAQLVRNTDDRLVLYALRGDDGSYVYKLVDKVRHLLIDVRQENLYRLGRFSDWNSLSTMLQRPSQPHRVVDLRRSQTTNLGACHFFRVEVGMQTEEVCWSRLWGLPMMMREAVEAGGTGGTARSDSGFRFKIDAVDQKPNAAAFRLQDQGLVAIHADEDIHPSSD
jgi:hypothetical protein